MKALSNLLVAEFHLLLSPSFSQSRENLGGGRGVGVGDIAYPTHPPSTTPLPGPQQLHGAVVLNAVKKRGVRFVPRPPSLPPPPPPPPCGSHAPPGAQHGGLEPCANPPHQLSLPRSSSRCLVFFPNARSPRGGTRTDSARCTPACSIPGWRGGGWGVGWKGCSRGFSFPSGSAARGPGEWRESGCGASSSGPSCVAAVTGPWAAPSPFS